jgi:hypothetical protein
MAQVKLTLEEAYHGDLPPVCMRCGKPATNFLNKTFSTGPFGLPFFAVPLPGVTIYSYSGKVWMKAPLCDAHQGHWRWRLLVIFLSFATVLAFGLFAFMSLVEPPRWLAKDAFGLLCPAALGAIVLWMFFALIVRYTGIWLARVGKETITLAGVSPEFRKAVEAKRQGQVGEPAPGGYFPGQEGGVARGITVTVVGDRSGTTALQKAGCAVREDARPQGDEIVLVAVSCRQSVEDKTLDSLDKAAGATARHLAILLTEADASLDKDLIELVEMESKFVLSSVVGNDAAAEKLLVLRTDDQQLGEKIKSLGSRKTEPIRLGKPDRREWQSFKDRLKT